eukprot:3054476-Pyramimonas_sp.AAC.1
MHGMGHANSPGAMEHGLARAFPIKSCTQSTLLSDSTGPEGLTAVCALVSDSNSVRYRSDRVASLDREALVSQQGPACSKLAPANLPRRVRNLSFPRRRSRRRGGHVGTN